MPLELVQAEKMAELRKNRPPLHVKSTRTRKYLRPTEVDAMMASAKASGRHGRRDAALVLLAFRHGLRVSELVGLRREQVDLDAGTIHVNRLKRGTPALHHLNGDEMRALRQLYRDCPEASYVFISERRAPLTTSSIRRIFARAGELAGITFRVNPHMLRHSAGFALAAKGQDTRAIQGYLGHRSILNTVIYTDLAPDRFKSMWKD